jgi:photosystem II stability/assembly factor-like uncharacterized protein
MFVRESFRGVPVSYATVDPRHGTYWACVDHGHWGNKLHRSLDEGRTWEEVPAPRYPEGAVRPDGEAATTSYLWIVQPGGDDQPNRLYVGTEPGGLFQSDDGGESFQLVESLWEHPSRNNWFGGGRDHAGLCSICVDPHDSNHVVVGISVGGVYETFDGGESWEGRNKGLYADYLPDPYAEYGHDPHFMVMSPVDPKVLWQQNHCGVFRSSDGAQQWENISQEGGPVYFGFPIALDPDDANVAWVVPAVDAEFRVPVKNAMVVCRTEDGGKSWKELRAGLPQENCYDLVFRHALDNRNGSLVMGTTNGNLYLSDDRGDSWCTVSGNLATVYSVRFAG